MKNHTQDQEQESHTHHPDHGHEMDHTDHNQEMNHKVGHEGMADHQQSHDTESHDMHPADHGNGHGDEHSASHVDHTGHELMFRDRFWVSLVLSLPVLYFSEQIQSWLNFSAPEFSGSQLITPLFSVVIFFYGGLPFLKMAIPEIKIRLPGMMTLISLAITVSFVYSLAALFFNLGAGFFWELVTLIDVMLLGHWIEMRSVRQASGALNELAKLLPDTAERIQENGETETILVSNMRLSDLILVRPGASVPADGVIVEGQSKVNQAMITGESKPIAKQKGDQVIGGTINGDGSLRVEVTATGNKTALAGIMRLVAEAQSSKSDTQVLADKAAGWLFYVAVIVAALTGVGWGLSIGFGLFALQRAVTVLVIACPHALGLAVPLVVAISTSSAAKNGILVRDRLAFEIAREIDVLIFDKTGTLTKGEQGVVGVATIDGWSEEKALQFASAIEGDSEHIIAKGVRQAVEARALELPAVTKFEAIKGRGVRGTINNQEIYVGGPRLLELLELDLPNDIADFSSQSGKKGQTVIYLAQSDQVVAGFALADIIRSESLQAIKQLKRLGIQVAMLTGDSQDVAKAVSEELGIDQYFAEVLPEDKDKKVADLQSQGKRVAMVGDGVNDAPALTRADVGIAIGSGTDVAVESAGIILVNNNPLDVVKIFTLSKASYRKMIENLIWATGYNVVAIPLAAGVLAAMGILLSPAIGALFMSLSTIIVAFNAQLLRRINLSPA